ncbi:hypothetical protein O1611_g3423 [Lasiodiplodia mahajangana]|uniref:Uncharacterized protein n=1 Tax=Lasiodiplodia mahajangana TaxID=1108764 RepID=A0ACC2JRU4_9PEZI|nr:hypothetical protein O1611_g3423 [Lasiodiplodia mahajangana]
MVFVGTPGLFAKLDDFVCTGPDSKSPGMGSCLVKRCYQHTSDERTYLTRDLSPETDGWDTLVQELKRKPRNGYCILFLPRCQGQRTIVANFTTLPVNVETWKNVARHLSIPKDYLTVGSADGSSLISVSRLHKAEDLQMSVGTTDFRESNGFAFGSTYFESRRFTCAIMVGCGGAQMRDVESLINLADANSSQHPLFMLSIFAEMQLKRLARLVGEHESVYSQMKKKLNPRCQNNEQSQDTNAPRQDNEQSQDTNSGHTSQNKPK